MTSDLPSTAARPAPAPREAPSGTPFLLVGGLPGAGKSTALRALADDTVGVTVLDPDTHRRRLAALLPHGTPYRCYRWLVHTLHAVAVLAVLLAGPRWWHRPLAVHDPATRPIRRAAVARLARWRGWTPLLVLLDVDRDTALAGQRARGRTLRRGSFDRHWRRWSRQRPTVLGTVGGWERVLLVPRAAAGATLLRLVGTSPALTRAGAGAAR
jgi:hypothetical protein